MRKLSTITRIVCPSAGHRFTLRYTILEKEMPCGLVRYGVQIAKAGSADSIAVRDLTTHYATIRNLLKTLARNTVTPTGLGDVLADWL